MPTQSFAMGIVVGLSIQGNPFVILYNPIELQRDCKTVKDCQGIKIIATKSWEIYKLHANLSKLSQNLHPTAISWVSQRDPTKPLAIRHNLLQSWGLLWDCRFKAIRLKSCFKPSKRLSDCNLPRIWPLIMQSIPDQGTIDPKIT